MPSTSGNRSAANTPTQRVPPSGDPRWRIGVISLLLLGLGGYLGWQDYYFPQADDQPAQWFGAAIRMGVIMALLWLAWPDLRKLSPWLLAMLTVLLPLLLLVIARWPRFLPYVLVGGVAIYFLRPRNNRRNN